MITLFNIMTTEGWIDVMWLAVDSTKIDRIPQQDSKPGSVIFFIVIIFFFHLFILNMFVGIVINVFAQEKQTLEMNHLLTETEMDWCENIVYCYKAKPLIKFIYTGNKVKDGCYGIAMYPLFDHFIFLCIVLNTICMALTWHNEPKSLSAYLA